MPQYKKFVLYYRERYVFLYSTVSLVAIAVALIIAVVKVVPLGGAVPLHYDIYFGIDRIGPWYHFFYVPLGGLFLVLLNTVIGYTIFTRDKYASYYLCLMGSFVSLTVMTYTIIMSLYIL